MPLSLRLLSLAALAAASPLSSIESYTQTLNARDSTAAVTEDQLNDFKFYIKHAAAAYCNSNTTAGSPITCSANSCTGVNATIVNSFSGLLTGIGGYVAIDDTRREIVLSLRGSTNIRNFINDAAFLQVPCDLTFGCFVHVGFLSAWNEIKKAATDALAVAIKSRPKYPLVATGHSLGGAVATYGTAEMRKQGLLIDLITYGCPRVGNSFFGDFVDKQPGAEYRITHVDDPVPRLPPILFNYVHLHTEYWLATGNATTVDYGVGDILICTGDRNLTCNGGTTGFDVAAHEHYFQPTSDCAPSLSLKARDDPDLA